jgi:uncharacterized coiled-coil protein SlyX
MTDVELRLRIEMLESRLVYQESALEELMRMLPTQEQLIREQAEAIQRFTLQFRTLLPSPVHVPEEETRPPHYLRRGKRISPSGGHACHP